ncbi:MAG: biotin transporter BioY [Phycisphaerae bacterium]
MRREKHNAATSDADARNGSVCALAVCTPVARRSAVWTPATPMARLARVLFQVLGGLVLLSLAAQVRVPIPGTDVPGTLQLLAVLLLGLGLNREVAVGSVALYLFSGGLGFGVFAPGSAGLLGPTGGYLVGFAIAVLLIGTLRGSCVAPLWRLWLAGLAGAGVVLGCGVVGRLFWLGDWSWAVATGLVPFVLKALVEVSLAVTLVAFWRGVPGRPAN